VGSGGVTFNITAGYIETLPGLTSGLITTTTASAANTIVFKKSGTGANPVITGSTGTASATEYIICLQGTDYITFDGIDVTDPSGTIEWGYALFKASATDGCQNVTIRNCNITMNKTNNNTIGVYANNVTPSAPAIQLNVTALSGTNSNIKIYSNTIQNANNCIFISGYNDLVSPYLYYDQNNEIGKDGANIISNFGGGSAANNGIFTIYQNNQKIANNNITGPSAGSGQCSGIQAGTANNSSIDIYNNTISIDYNGTGNFFGIYDARGNSFTGATVANIYNNTISNCTFPNPNKPTCQYLYINGGAAICNCYNNIVSGNTCGSATAASTGTIAGIYDNSDQNTAGIVSFHDNQVTNITRIQSSLGAAPTYYIYVNGGGTDCDMYNNIVDNCVVASSGACYGLYALNTGQGLKNIYNNTVTNLINSYGTVEGLTTANGIGVSLYNNKIMNITALGASSTIIGINLSTLQVLGNMFCYNNYVGDLKAPASTLSYAINGIKGNGSNAAFMGIYNNTIYLNATSTGTNFGSFGIYLYYLPTTIELKNNIIVNTSVANGTGFTAALAYYNTTISNYSLSSNNNNYYAGTPGPKNLIFAAGTTYLDQTLTAFKTRFYPGEFQSVSELPPFMSTITPMDLHINPATPTQVESAGQVISFPNISTDYDNNPRYPNTGYPNNPLYPAVAPDMGADEFAGIPIDMTSPNISFQPLANTSILTARTLIATITDLHGVPVSGAGLPRVAWKKFYNGTWSWVTGTSIGSDQYSFSFAGGVSPNDSIYYYVMAQDNWGTPNTGVYPWIGASGFTSNPPAASTPPTTPLKYKITTGICGTFMVGSGQVYPTLTAAIADLSSKDLTCPTTLLLTDNVYSSETYPVIIPNIPGSSSTNTLTIKPAPGIAPVFSGSYLGVSPTNWSLLSLNGAQWIIIDGSNTGGADRSLTFINSATGGFASAIGVYGSGMTPASNITVKNCVLQAHPDASSNAQGIVLYSIAGNAPCSNIVIDNNTINSGKYGVQIAGIASARVSNCQITNNTIGSLTAGSAIDVSGVYFTYANNILVQGNEIIGLASGISISSSSCYGVYIGPFSTNSKIRKNTIHDWWQTATTFPAGGGYGIYYSGESNSLTEISNNAVYNIKSPGQSQSVTSGNPCGIFLYSGGNIQVYHNSVWMNGAYLSGSTAAISGCLGIGNGVSNVDVRNNILKNSSQPASGTPASKSYAVTVGPGTSSITLNYNDYFVDGIGPNIGYYGGSDQASLTNWKTASLQDANSLSIDPAFTSATNLMPTTTGMNHSGTYILSVPTDILGITRTNPPDAGAYEYSVNPVIITNAATSLLSTGATLNGSINAANYIVNSFFEYGLTISYGTSLAGSPAVISGSSPTPISSLLTGLLPLTTYHYRLKGVTSGNLTVYGNDMTFTTNALPPAVITLAATSVSSSGANLNGNVNPNGVSATVSFDYGLTTAYGLTATAIQSPVNGSSAVSVNAPVTGLLPFNTYHFRVKSISVGGTSYGSDLTFTTNAIPATVITNSASSIAPTTATLNGSVNPNYAPATVSFDWGLTTAYGNNVTATPGTVAGSTATAVLANIVGLTWATTYHFRCVGVNAGGIAYGADMVFNTACPSIPVPGAISGPTAVCQNQNGITYSIAQVTNASGYTWTVPTGATISGGQGSTSINVNYSTTAVSGNVTVTPTNACSTGPTGTLAVIVNPMPVPTITGPATACAGYANYVYTTQAGMTGYNWTVSAGGSITAGPGTSSITVTWLTTGAKTVTVNYNNANGCTAAIPGSYNVTVNTIPVPTITGNNSMCVNSGYYTYTTETGMSGYNWTITSGGSIYAGAGTAAITVVWNNAGAQTVSVNYNNANGCQAINPTVFNVTVNDIPAAAGSINGTTTVCAGAQGVPYSVAAITGAQTYVWTLPTGATIASGAGTNIISVNYASNAVSGPITVQGNNLCGSGATSPALNITVTPVPAAAGTISGPTAVCQGEDGVVYTVPTITNATGYTWTVPAGATITSGANTSSIHVDFSSSASSGSVTVLGTNACGNGASSSLSVTVSPVPATPTITANGYVLTSSAANGNQWYHDGTAVTGATNQTYTVPASAPGWYWTVVTLGACSSDSSNHKYIQGVGIGEHHADQVNIYPVPNDGRFNISISSEREISYKLEIYNSLGVKVYGEHTITVNGILVTPIDLGSVASGLYTVVLRNTDNQVIRKILINK